jgi:hypothetical protein
MDDRALAISILERARDILAARLAERVVELGEEIIDDALGNSYGGEIDSLHDQVGLRLSHVNAMLANLPHLATPQFAASAASDADSTHLTSTQTAMPGLLPPPIETVATPAEVTTATRTAAAPQMASFQTFVESVLADDLEASAQTLASLFDIDVPRARRCAATFAEKLHAQPDFLDMAMRLRGELQSGSINGALLLLWECFGLRGLESIGVMQALKARLNAAGPEA